MAMILIRERAYLMSLHIDWRRMSSMGLGLAAATVGGIVASRIGLPAPWLTGGISAAAIAALVRPFSGPQTCLTNVAMMALGVSVGSRVGIETLEAALAWPVSLAAMIVTVAAMFIGSYVVLRTAFKWDGATAFWASCPGAVAIALSMATKTRANVVKVAIVQLMRIFAVMILLPVGLAKSSLGQDLESIDAPFSTLLLFLTCYALSLMAERLRIPAGMLVGGIFGAAICASSGLFAHSSPNSLVTPACIIISAGVGARFSNIRIKDVTNLLVPSVASLLVAASISLMSAVAVAYVTDLSVSQIIIAYAPGGLDALIAASILLGADSLYVAIHQVTRFVLLSLCLPVLAHIHERRSLVVAEDASDHQ